MHTQYIYQKYFPNILVIVVEIGHSEVRNVECFKLTEHGMSAIDNCNKTLYKPTTFHALKAK